MESFAIGRTQHIMTERKSGGPSSSKSSSDFWDKDEWGHTSHGVEDSQDAPLSAADRWNDGDEWPEPRRPMVPPPLPPRIAVPRPSTPPPIPKPVIAVVKHVEVAGVVPPQPPPTPTPASAVANVGKDESTKQEAAEETTTETVESKAAETEATASVEEATTETAESTESDTQESTDSSEAPESEEGDSFVLDGVRNDGVWGKSDQAWEATDWSEDKNAEPEEEAEVVEEAEALETEKASEEALPDNWPKSYTQGGQPLWVDSFKGPQGYLLVFVFALLVFGSLFGKRIGQVSAEPHFAYLADAFLKGKWYLSEAPRHPVKKYRMGNDWGYMDEILVTRVNGTPLAKLTKLRGRWLGRRGYRQTFLTLKGRYTIYRKDVRHSKRYHFVSFPPFPSFLMMGPMWALGKMGYDRKRFSDISFTLFFAALSVLLMFVLLQRLSASGFSHRTMYENLQLTILYGFGSVFFAVAGQGTVWFTALIIGTCLSLAFLIAGHDAKHPFWAGVFVGLGFLTRPLLILLSLVFLFFVIRKDGKWLSPFEKTRLRTLTLFALPVAVALAGMMMFNQHRFGHPMEFGHAFLPVVFDRVKQYGLFHYHWLPRNFYSFFLAVPETSNMLGAFNYAKYPTVVAKYLPLIPKGLIPVLAVVQKVAAPLLVGFAGVAIWRSVELRKDPHKNDFLFWFASLGFVGLVALFWAIRLLPFPRINAHGLSLFITMPFLLFLFFDRHRHPWFWGLLGGSLIIIMMQLFYQNTGWLTFGNRFSLDYLPLLMVLVAVSGVTFGRLWKFALVCALAINLLGATTLNRVNYLYERDFNSLNWIFKMFS